KEIGDLLRSKLVSGVGLLASVVNGSVSMVCVVTDDLIHSRKLHAGNLVKEVAKMAGGTGGGRPHLATAGAKNPEAVDDALNYLKILIKK
ncbi:MAG: alanine--tRNA ligase, partial [Bacteroidetes bacterium]|nr:alanine--tRNA ligase [Bacteroidota bacterium]